MDKFANMDGGAKNSKRRSSRKTDEKKKSKTGQYRAESVGSIMRNGGTEKKVEISKGLKA